MSFLKRLLSSVFGLVDGLLTGVWEGLFGVRQPPLLDPDHADLIAEDAVDTTRLRDLQAEIAAERAALARPMDTEPPAWEPERWYRVLAPNDETYCFAHGTASEAEDYYRLGADGWRTEPVTAADDIFVLESARGSTAKVMGARIRSLESQVSDWREERSSLQN